jgi:hypothetical protein
MNIVNRECFEVDWIKSFGSSYPSATPNLIEKTIYAFELLGLLTHFGKPFIFKGGTSLLLLLPELKRLSIDVDIIGEYSLADMQSVIKDSIFQRVEEDERGSSGIPKTHFKILYNSKIDNKREAIILDILTAEHPYNIIQTIPIGVPFITLELATSVTVPTINSIIGDKLTAFAPNTLGVPYYVEKTGRPKIEKSMQLIKQLFDIGELFLVGDDISEIRQTYAKNVKQENLFWSKKYSIDEVLEDTIRTAYLICRIDLKGAVENDKTSLIRKGVQQISAHLLTERYSLLKARVSAARAAFLAALLRYPHSITDLRSIRYDAVKKGSYDLSDLSGKLAPLTRLRNMSDEAYYYWKKIDTISSGLQDTVL